MHSKHFKIQELVPKDIFLKFGEKSWWFVRPDIIAVADTLREMLDRTVIINDWNDGGLAQYRGFRPSNCKIGALYSQHKLGAAVDVVIPGMQPREVIAFIQANKAVFIPLGLSTIENNAYTPTWTHLDVRARTIQHPMDDFLFVNP